MSKEKEVSFQVDCHMTFNTIRWYERIDIGF
jgi:hypothetical protein